MTERPPMPRTDAQVAATLAELREVIAAEGRDDVTIVAVTKGFDRSAVECAARVGLDVIGENYAQELLEKSPLPDEVQAHFIGRIQRNKVRKIADIVDLWHSVSRPEVLVELAKRSPAPRALIQVAAADDPSKDGIDPKDLDMMLEVAHDHGVTIEGLMTIGVLGNDHRSAQSFRDLSRLADSYGLIERSMGMSGDYRDALAEGATMLRLGSALFGQRPTTGSV